jgi:ribosome-associated protein
MKKKIAAKKITGKKVPPRKKKGGPLRSKKPGKNQVAQARRLGPALGPARRKALRPRAPAEVAAETPRPSAPVEERPDSARGRADLIARAGLDKKAEDVLVLDVRGLTSYADYFVLMTADSDRQAGAIADAVDETLEAEGASKVGVEGYQGGRWILVDYGDVVAHVFNREARGFYDLEGLWADAPRFAVEG